CEKHDLRIDLTCEDCDEFICSQCAKTDHKDHDWTTIPTAGSLKRRELRKTLSKVKEEDVKKMEKNIQKATKLMENNQQCCDSEVSKFQKHYEAIVSKLAQIKKNLETNLKKNLEQKNAEVIEKKLDLEKKTKQVMDLVKFLEEKHGTMSDYSLIENLRDLRSLVSNTDIDIEKGDHSVRYRKGDINNVLLESMMGQTLNLDEITVNETHSFQYGDQPIVAMEAINEDTCFVRYLNSGNIQQVNRRSENGMKINIIAYNVYKTDNGDVYATDYANRSIVRLSPSGSVSTVFSTAPLVPWGICQSTEGGLLVTLKDTESEPLQPDSHSRRLVRHVTLTGDVIREYEYQEDGQTRLFTLPYRVRQNGNTDICVVNRTSTFTGELVILSFSGSLKSVYLGQKLMEKFSPTDVVCDKQCNIIVNDFYNSKIHLLSPNVEFMKYLLTENEVTNPCSMSLYNSTTLWVGDYHGLVKVFQYKT
uniref:B box-type domain-containing protein n=1 Tax=Magallana gigas TaxID=29159 RepID=A0A8W8MUN2_MAGGI